MSTVIPTMDHTFTVYGWTYNLIRNENGSITQIHEGHERPVVGSLRHYATEILSLDERERKFRKALAEAAGVLADLTASGSKRIALARDIREILEEG